MYSFMLKKSLVCTNMHNWADFQSHAWKRCLDLFPRNGGNAFWSGMGFEISTLFGAGCECRAGDP